MTNFGNLINIPAINAQRIRVKYPLLFRGNISLTKQANMYRSRVQLNFQDLLLSYNNPFYNTFIYCTYFNDVNTFGNTVKVNRNYFMTVNCT